MRRAAPERRALVTNNARDFRPRHDRLLAAGEEHYGLLFTFDETMPRRRRDIVLWVSVLGALLDAHPDDGALRNRVHLLP